MLFGGGEAGTVTVKSGPDKESECARAGASVELETTAKINGLVMGLATASDALGRKTSSRRFPTAGERATVSDIAKGIFRHRGVASVALEDMRRSTSLRLTGRRRQGGNHRELHRKDSAKERGSPSPFFNSRARSHGFDVDLMRYSRTTAGDLPGGASLDDVNQPVLTDALVDQLDINNDKMAESSR